MLAIGIPIRGAAIASENVAQRLLSVCSNHSPSYRRCKSKNPSRFSILESDFDRLGKEAFFEVAFNLEHHLIDRVTVKERRSAALADWQLAMA